MQVALLRVALFFVCIIMCVNFCHAQASTPTPIPQLFYEDTTASQRVITHLAVDNAGNVISFTLQTAPGCGFGICGAVLYSIAPNGSTNWVTPSPNYVANTVNQIAISSNNNIFFQDFIFLQKIQGISSSGKILPNWPVLLGSALDTGTSNLLIDPIDQSILAKGGAASAFEPPSTRTASFRQDGSPKWIMDLTGGGDNTPGMFFGPNNNIYTFSDHTLLLDRNDGHTICEFVVQPRGDVFVPITGGEGLLFSSTTTQVLRSDFGCIPLSIYNWDTNRHGFLLGYDHGALFAEDRPNNGFPGTARFIAISKDGAPLWTNTAVAPQNIVAIRQGLIYVLGVDAVNGGSTPKLFVVGENDGGVITSLDLVAICSACFAVAVDSTAVYVGDLSSTRIYKVSGINATSCDIDVRQEKQNDSAWTANLYDHSDKITIGEKGCAVTSLSMALSHEGLSIDPGALNKFMRDTDTDYNGLSVNWGPATSDASRGILQFHSKRINSTVDLKGAEQYLDTILCKKRHPVIVGVNVNQAGDPSHFVLVTGKKNGDFQIADPFSSKTTLSQYANRFVTRGFVADPPGDLSELSLALGDVAELLLIDPSGRKTGFDMNLGQIVEDIPNSAYFRDALQDDISAEAPTETDHLTDVSQPLQGTYQISLAGLKLGTYSLSVRIFSQDGTPQPELHLSGVTGPGSASSFLVQLTSTPGSASIIEAQTTFLSTLDDLNNSLQLGLIDNRGIANSLAQKIRAAQNATGIERNGVLRAFINEINAQSTKHISGVAIQVLLTDARGLMAN